MSKQNQNELHTIAREQYQKIIGLNVAFKKQVSSGFILHIFFF